jgi:predicted transcriptional regulator
MPRPKKSPRVRVQIVFENAQAKALRAYAKKTDRDISQVIRHALDAYLDARILEQAVQDRAAQIMAEGRQ